MSGPIFRLVLHPKNAEFALDSWDQVISRLSEAGFLGKPYLVDNVSRFYIGEQFLQMLTFMGCSPNVEIEPAEPGSVNFCHIALGEITADVKFRQHERDVFARCPECGRRDSQWPEMIMNWRNQQSLEYTCPSCASTMSPYALRWRSSAGFARMFIDILSVYPNEAVPTEQLMSLLKQASAQEWTYFYCKT